LATTYDIAKRAGVDQSTVSKVLSGATNFRQSTVERVRKACADCNYVPNSTAVALRTSRSRALAVHLPFGEETLLSDPFIPEFRDGARRSPPHNIPGIHPRTPLSSLPTFCVDPSHSNEYVHQELTDS